MRTKLFIASALAVVVGSIAFAGAAVRVKPTVTTMLVKTEKCNTDGQPCCTPDDCCEQCIECCSIDGCCEECIEMGCDPCCYFQALTSAKPAAPKKGEVCCTKSAKKVAKGCCGDGCCK